MLVLPYLKLITYDILYMARNIEFVGIGENVGYHHFLLFSPCLQQLQTENSVHES